MRSVNQKRKRISIYFKYFCDEQRESILRTLKRHIINRGATLACVFCDSINARGVELDRLMQCVMSGAVEAILVPDLCMLGSDRLLVEKNIAIIRYMCVELFILNNDFSFVNYSLLRAIRSYNSLGSQWENEYGDLYKKPVHKLYAGNLPFGYYRGENGQPIVEEEDAEIVRKIFGMCSMGIGAREIAERIEEEDGINISRSTVRLIIENKRYCSNAHGRMDTFQPLVSNGLWLRANSVQHRRSSREKIGRTHLLEYITVAGSRIILEPSVSMILRDCGNAYSCWLTEGRFEANACIVDTAVVDIVSHMLESDGQKLRDEVKSYKTEQRAEMLETMKELERSGLITETDAKIALGKLNIEELAKFESLRLRIRENRQRYVRAKLDYLLFGMDDDEIDDYFDHMFLFKDLGLLEKQYYIDLLVRKVIIADRSIKLQFINGKVIRKNFERRILYRQLAGSKCRWAVDIDENYGEN